MKIKKNISIEDTLKDKAMKRAKQLSMNFSSYITYLIDKDLGELAVMEEKPKKNDKINSAIDKIMGL